MTAPPPPSPTPLDAPPTPIDEYYTKAQVAEECLADAFPVLSNLLNLKDALFLEPAVGRGDFYLAIRRRGYEVMGVDRNPKCNPKCSPECSPKCNPKCLGVAKLDFLHQAKLMAMLRKYRPETLRKYRPPSPNNIAPNIAPNISTNISTNIITIGNPPFGKKAKLAIAFFNQASIFSRVIAFIVPNQFRKYSVHKQLNPDYQLIYQSDLAKNSFYTDKQENYHVNCVFQIWTKLENHYPNQRITQKPPIVHEDFAMYQYNNTPQALKVLANDFDFAVLGQGYGDYGKIITKREDFNPKKQYLLFKCRDEKTQRNLRQIDFKQLAEGNTVVKGFRKHDVVREYQRRYGKPTH